MQNAPLGAFCNTFDLHKAIIGLEKQFSFFFLRVAVLHRFYCTVLGDCHMVLVSVSLFLLSVGFCPFMSSSVVFGI